MPPKRAESEESTSAKLQETVVRYVGLSDARVILKDQWALIDIDNEDVEWNRSNHFTVRASDLSEQALGYCKSDPELVITTV